MLSDEGAAEIYTSRTDGSDLQRLTRHRSIDVSPSWSPDGSRIAFIRCAHGSCDVFAVNPDGSGLVQLTSFGSAHSLAWSPDGAGIAVARWPRDGSTSIVIVSATYASDPVAVAAPGYAPAWRPARVAGG